MAGDTIEISAKAFYNVDNALPETGIDFSAIAGAFVAAITNPVGTIIGEVQNLTSDLGAAASQSSTLGQIPNSNDNNNQVQPQSGINFVAYNNRFDIVEANTGVLLVEDKINTIQTLATDRIVMKEAGYIEIFIDNQAQTPVYYDIIIMCA